MFAQYTVQYRNCTKHLALQYQVHSSNAFCSLRTHHKYCMYTVELRIYTQATFPNCNTYRLEGILVIIQIRKLLFARIYCIYNSWNIDNDEYNAVSGFMWLSSNTCPQKRFQKVTVTTARMSHFCQWLTRQVFR